MSHGIKRKEISILVLCILLGFALRTYTFDQRSLWMDEIHTFNDSEDGLVGQLEFYHENPNYFHPPLFFLLTHLFYPFTNPEKDLRIFPLIFGILSIPMFYLLARSFSADIALPCTLSLTLMAYHISLSQDGRSYSLLLFLGMVGLYFFMKYLKTEEKSNLILVALAFATLFYTSYSSIPFIALSQILWFYRPREESKEPRLSSFFILNGTLLLLCLPWIVFLGYHFKAKFLSNPFHTESVGSLWTILYGILHDWVPYPPLLIVSILLFISFPFLSQNRRNAVVLLAVFILPIVGLYFFCTLLDITHFITSRYFINFLPLFFISLFLSLSSIEFRFERLKKFLRLRFLFIMLFTISNLFILPLYYRSEKQDIRGLATYLKGYLRSDDKIFVETASYIPGILHYLGIYPTGRHYTVFSWRDGEKGIGVRKTFDFQNAPITIYHSKTCCTQYVADGSRLWIIVSKWGAKKIKGSSPCVLKGYFDGSFLNFNKFPDDASIYLFLWDPKSTKEKGIDMPIE